MEVNAKESTNIDIKKVNKLCNVTLWFGIVSIFLSFIGIIPLIGVIVSIIALIKYNKESQKGLKRGIAGLVELNPPILPPSTNYYLSKRKGG